MTVLVLLRHGESAWNAQDLFAGWTDVGLSERGRQQAGRAGAQLAARGFLPEDADLAGDTSPLPATERPVTVAQVGADRGHDRGDRGGQHGPHAMVQVKQVIDAVRNEHPGDTDNREFHEFLNESPESLVLRPPKGHRGAASPTIPPQ
jgi:broad specificity phosphatase PhoE